MTHDVNKTRGQAMNTTTIIMGAVMFVGSWAGNFLFNNAKDAPQAVAQVSERVAKVEVNDKNQDETISEMKDDVKHIRGLMDQWAQKQGITIKTQ